MSQDEVEDVAERFWKEWLEASEIKRHEMLRPIAKLIMDAASSGISVEGLTTYLKSYFDDLAETCKKLYQKP